LGENSDIKISRGKKFIDTQKSGRLDDEGKKSPTSQGQMGILSSTNVATSS